MSIKCSSCLKVSPAESLFCIHCGNAFGAKCGKCGELLQPGSIFCIQCGFRINTGPEEDFKENKSGSRSNHSKNSDHKYSKGSTKDEMYYGSILDLKGRQTPHEIKDKYRELARQYHPDKVSHLGPKLRKTAETEMKLINAAFEYFKQKYGI